MSNANGMNPAEEAVLGTQTPTVKWPQADSILDEVVAVSASGSHDCPYETSGLNAMPQSQHWPSSIRRSPLPPDAVWSSYDQTPGYPSQQRWDYLQNTAESPPSPLKADKQFLALAGMVTDLERRLSTQETRAAQWETGITSIPKSPGHIEAIELRQVRLESKANKLHTAVCKLTEVLAQRERPRSNGHDRYKQHRSASPKRHHLASPSWKPEAGPMPSWATPRASPRDHCERNLVHYLAAEDSLYSPGNNEPGAASVNRGGLSLFELLQAVPSTTHAVDFHEMVDALGPRSHRQVLHERDEIAHPEYGTTHQYRRDRNASTPDARWLPPRDASGFSAPKQLTAHGSHTTRGRSRHITNSSESATHQELPTSQRTRRLSRSSGEAACPIPR